MTIEKQLIIKSHLLRRSDNDSRIKKAKRRYADLRAKRLSNA